MNRNKTGAVTVLLSALALTGLAGCSASAQSSQSGATCDASGATSTFERCALIACCAELNACTNDGDCSAVVTCINDCNGSDSCTSSCLQAFPRGAGLLHSYSSCQSQNCGPSAGGTAGSGGTTGPTTWSPGGCSSDGSDLVVAGSYYNEEFDLNGYPSAYIVDVFVPDCTHCHADINPQGNTGPLTDDGWVWSSAWAPDHSQILVMSNGVVRATVTADGKSYQYGSPDSAGSTAEDRQGEGGFLARCDGYFVISSSNFSQ